MSSDEDLRDSYKKFIRNLPQLLTDQGAERVYALHQTRDYSSLRLGGPQDEVTRLAQAQPYWYDAGFFCLAELYDKTQLNHDDTYFLALMNLNVTLRHTLLHHDAQFRSELLWSMLTVEGTAETSLTTVDKNTFKNTWQHELHQACDEGLIPRARLLDACLNSLARDFTAYRAGWFSRMYAALKPTAAESASRQGTLVNLLGSPVTATVTLAVKHLAAVHQAGLLDANGFIYGCAPALLSSKANALAVLKILESLRGTVDDAPVVAAAVTALGHTHPQVQQAAAKLLSRTPAAETLHEHAENLSPVARQNLENAGILTQPAAQDDLTSTDLAEPPHPAPEPDAQNTQQIPGILEDIRVSWDRRESEQKRPNGKPQYVWWSPTVHLPAVQEQHTLEEKLLLNTHYAECSCEELALICPSSTVPVALGLLEHRVFLDEEEGRRYLHDMVQVLGRHPGQWNSITAQALAVLAASKSPADRAGAAELLTETLGGRLSYEDAVCGFSQAAPALALTRWAHTFEDAAGIDPRIVLRFLGKLLPHCERTQHGMGKLLGVYVQEYLRAHREHHAPPLSFEMSSWLGGFRGSSQAAQHARTILKTAG